MYPGCGCVLGVFEFRMRRLDFLRFCFCEVVSDCIRKDEISVGKALHQRAGAEAVGAVVGVVRFADHKEAGHVAHEEVVDPETAHGVVRGRVNAHGRFVCVFAGNAFVHFEQVPVALLDDVCAEAVDRVREVQVNAFACGADAAAFVADLFSGARGDVSRCEVAEARVLAFEIVVAFVLGDVRGGAAIAFFPGHPDASVVAEGLGHECEFGLLIAADGDAGGVDLSEARIGEGRAFFVSPEYRRCIAAAGVGGKVEHVSITARCEDNRVGGVRGDFAGDEISDDDARRASVYNDEIEHFSARMHLNGTLVDLPRKRLVGADEELLSGLAPGVKGS